MNSKTVRLITLDRNFVLNLTHVIYYRNNILQKLEK